MSSHHSLRDLGMQISKNTLRKGKKYIDRMIVKVKGDSIGERLETVN